MTGFIFRFLFIQILNRYHAHDLSEAGCVSGRDHVLSHVAPVESVAVVGKIHGCDSMEYSLVLATGAVVDGLEHGLEQECLERFAQEDFEKKPDEIRRELACNVGGD